MNEKLKQRKEALARKQAENDLLKRQIKTLQDKISELSEKALVAKEALAFLTAFADSRRGSIKTKIEAIATEAIGMIYDRSYGVAFTYSTKNNRSCLDIEMVRKTQAGEVRRDIDGFGGGVADTISVPLRLCVLIGTKTDRVCVLDECWKHIDEDRIPMVGEFLRVLADRLKIQIVFCSHLHNLSVYADNVYRITESDGCSEVKAP